MNASLSLEANRASRASRAFCSHCKKKGYIEARYYKKYPELKPKGANSSSSPKSKEDSKEDSSLDNTKAL